MSKRSSVAAANGAASKDTGDVTPPCTSADSRGATATAVRPRKKTSSLTAPTAIDKQKILLSSDAGRFSLVRALHLADFITELNGEQSPASFLTAQS